MTKGEKSEALMSIQSKLEDISRATGEYVAECSTVDKDYHRMRSFQDDVQLLVTCIQWIRKDSLE